VYRYVTRPFSILLSHRNLLRRNLKPISFTYIDRGSSGGVAARPRAGPDQVNRNNESVERGCGDPISRVLSSYHEYSEPGKGPRSEGHCSPPASDEIVISLGYSSTPPYAFVIPLPLPYFLYITL
jgi:hypothetical protein